MNLPPCLCPACRAPMQRHAFARKLQGTVELDFCFPCQGLWFDDFESLQLAPDGVVAVFELMHQHHDVPRRPLPAKLFCPRCNEALIVSQDRVKSGLFNYQRCLQKHGRFISFGQFMIEKGFVRQLTGIEIDDLAARIGTVQCNSCGAPVDIRHDSACRHCRAPIAVLDPAAVDKALAGYRAPRQAPPTPVLDPRLAAEAAMFAAGEQARSQRQPLALLSTDIADLLMDGVAAALQRLKG